MTSQLASRDQLFSTASMARRYVEVTLPVSGHSVRLQSLTERERATFQSGFLDKRGEVRKDAMLNSNRRLIVLCVVDAVGNRILNQDDVGRMVDWDTADVQFLASACGRHTGIAAGEMGDVNEAAEDLEKNSETTAG